MLRERGAAKNPRPQNPSPRHSASLGPSTRSGSALQQCTDKTDIPGTWVDRAGHSLDPEMHDWLDRRGLSLSASPDAGGWTCRAQSLAFEYLRRTIVTSGRHGDHVLQNTLRSDEIAWGRCTGAARPGRRLDRHPALQPGERRHGPERRGLLNGQPPVQVYARVTAEPVIRVRSIDLGTHLDILVWDDLFDYSSAVGAFSLVKAALVISGFTPLSGGSDRNRPLREVLSSFGGGLEITTLAAIPKGSGLGTSSIMGAVLLAVINRTMGRTLSHNELFHNVLRLEQELTTGGGWQDQIGGSIGGLKLATIQGGSGARSDHPLRARRCTGSADQRRPDLACTTRA